MSDQKFLGYKAIGELFGVSPATVSKWRTRYDGTDHACPEPDVWIDDTPGWTDANAWQAWKLGLPGRGNGGGPLPLAQARTEYLEALETVRQLHPNGRHLERRALNLIADSHGVDQDGLARLAVDIMDKNPQKSNEECDIIAIATAIRGARKARAM
ncbi:hypothetical protein IU433_12175 [Nocardia puris]|uniref:hypothetical protein n=1 Tax=Nocardia puris TaxID=208602 RepID=UPI001895951E|nr:hypothetical protein [Nocardia puris]MBF6459793.1 hypothetical protein [Nocardia puris]